MNNTKKRGFSLRNTPNKSISALNLRSGRSGNMDDTPAELDSKLSSFRLEVWRTCRQVDVKFIYVISSHFQIFFVNYCTFFAAVTFILF